MVLFWWGILYSLCADESVYNDALTAVEYLATQGQILLHLLGVILFHPGKLNAEDVVSSSDSLIFVT